MYLLAPNILQNFLKILRADPELRGCAIFGPKMAHLWWTKFFWYKQLLLLSSTYWPFSLCKILKNSYFRSRVTRMQHFWAQNGPFAPNKIFFGKLLISLSKILKNSASRSRVTKDVQFLGPKWPISANENFFQKTC